MLILFCRASRKLWNLFVATATETFQNQYWITPQTEEQDKSLKYHFKNVDNDCAGYFDGVMKFLNDYSDWKPIHSEYRFYHKVFLYAGTCDLLFETPKGIVLLDLKTTVQAHTNMWGVQLSAYRNGIENYCPSLKISATKVLQVSNDGNYILHDIQENFSVFLACLQIKNFKE